MNHIVSQLWIYPIKSLAGCKVEEVAFTERGLALDRRWMLVDANGRFITQRQFPMLSQLLVIIQSEQLVVYPKNNPDDVCRIPLSLPSDMPSIEVSVWDDLITAQLGPDTTHAWFSKQLQTNVRLVYMPEASKRFVNPKYASHQEIVHFADGYPVLIISEESLAELATRLGTSVPIERFRPNVVVKGGQAHDEDQWRTITINEQVQLRYAKPCSRCMMVNIDPFSGLSSPTVLKTLGTYRRFDKKINFGSHFIVRSLGSVSVGSTVFVSKNFRN